MVFFTSFYITTSENINGKPSTHQNPFTEFERFEDTRIGISSLVRRCPLLISTTTYSSLSSSSVVTPTVVQVEFPVRSFVLWAVRPLFSQGLDSTTVRLRRRRSWTRLTCHFDNEGDDRFYFTSHGPRPSTSNYFDYTVRSPTVCVRRGRFFVGINTTFPRTLMGFRPYKFHWEQ